jgi:RimJ/RimL family protein N-acetyltransferase
MKSYANNASIIIRTFEVRDVDELNELLLHLSEYDKKFFHPHSFDLEVLREICDSKKDHYFVMVLNNRIIGYSFLRLFGYKIPSFGCCIFNRYKNKGYGTILTRWTVNKAKELGYNKVILKTYKKNISAYKIYKNIGFEIIGETEDNKQFRMEIEL